MTSGCSVTLDGRGGRSANAASSCIASNSPVTSSTEAGALGAVGSRNVGSSQVIDRSRRYSPARNVSHAMTAQERNTPRNGMHPCMARLLLRLPLTATDARTDREAGAGSPWPGGPHLSAKLVDAFRRARKFRRCEVNALRSRNKRISHMPTRFQVFRRRST